MKNNTYNGLLYACAKGKQKEWARERLFIDILYDTNDDMARYLKIQNFNLLPAADEETESYYIYKFGYFFRMPKTEIDLYINKKNGKMYIKKEGLGIGYDDVEKCIYDFIKTQIKRKNVYLQTNINGEEYIVK